MEYMPECGSRGMFVSYGWLPAVIGVKLSQNLKNSWTHQRKSLLFGVWALTTCWKSILDLQHCRAPMRLLCCPHRTSEPEGVVMSHLTEQTWLRTVLHEVLPLMSMPRTTIKRYLLVLYFNQ